MASVYGSLAQGGFSSPVASFALLNQIYFVLISTAVLAAATLPFLRASVLSYGKLDATPSSTTSTSTTRKSKKEQPSRRDSWIKTVKSLQVPKVWFSHFYVWAPLWMIYMTLDLWVYSSSAVVLPPTTISYSTRITVIRSMPTILTSTQKYWSLLTFLNYLGIMPAHIPLAWAQSATEPLMVRAWVPPPHVLLTMACYLLQVIRRWYESWFVERPSVDAKMHVAHYIVGITFYSAMAPTTWIDAYEAWLRQGGAISPVNTTTPSPMDSMLFGLNGQCLLGLILFIWGSYHQYNCHVILANLRPKPSRNAGDKSKEKPAYRVPFGDWFQYMVAPHYSAEMVIYLGLYLMGSSSPLTASSSTAPTLLCAWIWVIFNLGILARETDQWYRARFGDRYATVGAPADTKAGRSGRAPSRYILVPFIY
ncbi:Steroid 5 alpha-reductase 3 [Mortierella sp. 14UC]|nr:Steroid 5 alpha-reductase 3 [Mortierella sp. 14UC]